MARKRVRSYDPSSYPRMRASSFPHMQPQGALLRSQHKYRAPGFRAHTIERDNANTRDIVSLLQERISELEFSQEDAGWIELSSADADMNREFSRNFLRVICRSARLYYLKNPYIKRAVDLQASYVFGQGITITAEDEDANDVLQEFWDDTGNQDELTSHEALLGKETDLQTSGNIFFIFFTNAADGNTKIRSIQVDEITRIIANPQDRRDKWFYMREWTEYPVSNAQTPIQNAIPKPRKAYYPDWRYSPSNKPKNAEDGIEIFWDYPIYHVRTGGLPDMLFGVPEVYAALDWATAYKRFLEQWAILVESLSQFAWKQTVKGGAQAVQGVRAKIDSMRSENRSTDSPVTRATERMPVGSVAIVGDGNDITPMPKTGMTVSAEDGRRLLLNICAATGWPETFFGDVSVGTLATAASLDRPTELRMKNRQQLWSSVLASIGQYVIERKIGAPANTDTGMIESTKVQVSFPSVVQHDILEIVDSIVRAATLGGGFDAGTIPAELLQRLLLEALKGVTDIDIDTELESAQEDEQAQTAPEVQAARIRAKTYAHLAEREYAAERVSRTHRKLQRAIDDNYNNQHTHTNGHTQNGANGHTHTRSSADTYTRLAPSAVIDIIEQEQNTKEEITQDDIKGAQSFWKQVAPQAYKNLLNAETVEDTETPPRENT